MERTLTAPIAIIKAQVGDELKVIGRMRNIRVTESIRRYPTKGIGEIYPQELLAVDWSGTLTAQSYFINLKTAGLTAPNRKTNDPVKFANTLLLEENGIDVYIYRKVKNEVNPDTGIIETIVEDLVASIRHAFVEREAFDIAENQVSGRDQDFSYSLPILFDFNVP